ncbi:MAG TPA: histidinol-phosphatase, partial [Nitrospiria bacterium]|nr:histidinol-phosphatase [Nitrospiria bacterium]
MTKQEVSEILEEIGTLLELKGENPFKSRAYANAARAIESLGQPLETVFAPQSEASIKGIGDSLHEKICELVATGKLAYYE